MKRHLLAAITIAAAGAGPARTPLYYQDPDGKPFYAAAPHRSADGRAWRPVFTDAPATEGTAASPHILYYRNPMGLADTSPRPKKDPMGMDYLPVYAAGQGETAGTVTIDAGRLQTLGVRTAVATIGPAEARPVLATGILRFDERSLATVTTKVPGWIEHLAVAATGDPVRRGQVLAELYAPDLVASEQEYLIASSMGGAIGQASVDRLRALDIPAPEIARLRRTRRAARRIAVLAPADGVVIDKPVQEGMRIEAGEALYRTADLSRMWLIAEVQEPDLGRVQPGARARARITAFPGRRFDGTVDFIYPSLSAATRTGRVRIVLANPDGALREGMAADLRIEPAAGAAQVLSVPQSAILDSGARQVVLRVEGQGRFEPRTVHLGARGSDRVQVLDGIAAGDRVVVGANFLIDAESNLRAALQGFADADKPASAQAADAK